MVYMKEKVQKYIHLENGIKYISHYIGGHSQVFYMTNVFFIRYSLNFMQEVIPNF